MVDANQIREFRNALGRFATGVTIITTTAGNDEPIGLTANSFSSVSLDPPLLLFCLDRESFSFGHFEQSEHFAVNILSADQEDISSHFARPSEDKWRHVDYDLCGVGCPSFSDALAIFECKTHAVYDGGDHVIIVGKVVDFTHRADGEPLLYHRGRYARIAPEPDEGIPGAA